MSEAARSRRSDARLEPQLNIPSSGAPARRDPLAELARLVGQEDPFRNVFRPQVGNGAVRPPAAANADQYDDDQAGKASAEAGHGYPPYAEDADPSHLGLRASAHDAQDWPEAEHDSYDTEHAHHTAEADHEYAAYENPVSPESEHDLSPYAAPPLTPDLWAEGAEHASSGDPARATFSDETAPIGRAPRRPMIVLAAVLLLTGGGLAATFMARSGASTSLADRPTPTIMAAAGPNKVKLDTTTEATPEDADAALLNKNGASSGGPAKVVNSQEQPIDLAQMPKAAPAEGAADAGSSSPFPEPRKVKTFLVRPDGSMSSGVASAAAASAARAPVPQIAMGSVPSDAERAPAPAARPATPKTSVHTATTPKTAPTTIADLTTTDATEPAAPTKAKSLPKVKPVETADAGPSATATTSGGGFALQLAASPSEQDAREMFTRLQKKYSAELGGRTPTIHKADKGDKSVYRLRVGGLNQDDAKTLCSQLQASGGSCFVVRNN